MSGAGRIDLVIAGAEKAGTTSLHSVFTKSPGICTHLEQEFLEFNNPDGAATSLRSAAGKYRFTTDPGGVEPVVVKHAGALHQASVLERIHLHSPEAHLVILLRNPVARAYSAWQYHRRLGREVRESFREAFLADRRTGATSEADFPPQAYFRRGLYGLQLERALRHFSSERVHVFTLDQFVADPDHVIETLGLILGVPLSRVREIPRRNPSRKARSTLLAKWLARPSRARAITKSILGSRRARAFKQTLQRLNSTRTDRRTVDPRELEELMPEYSEDSDRLAEFLGERPPWN